MRFRYVACPNGSSYIRILYPHGEGQLHRVPVFFQTFLNEVLGRYLIHSHQCRTSRLAYLRSDYINILHRADKYLDFVLSKIRQLDDIIAAEWVDTRIPEQLVLDISNDEAELRSIGGEVIYTSAEVHFYTLLFSWVLTCK